MTDLIERARAWIAGDPDPATRSELEALIASGNRAELSDRLDDSLEFGTAGLRGTVGAGPNRMNLAVVI
ncbi:MAG: phospho-sugar mutase, partial [Actinobacteria bacterium]|nr:phospho-sugar mutase [Actinomycetota bacterium]